MDVAALLLELYGRIPPLVDSVVDGLTPDQLTHSPEPGANTIGWLVWHLTRVQDDHIAALLDTTQIWSEGDWATRLGVPFGDDDIGYGHTREQMESVRPTSVAELVEYHQAVDARTREMLAALAAASLERIVDRNWDPPVTLGVRLVSVADDSLQHLGQAAYVRGLLDR